ncbi:uncharacterized protein [Penaeus vannamei]|uniref:uncharacterized protein n=1 Tax=Penaeus vannamei TaxID=6689 RepID=UPI00387F5ABB
MLQMHKDLKAGAYSTVINIYIYDIVISRQKIHKSQQYYHHVKLLLEKSPASNGANITTQSTRINGLSKLSFRKLLEITTKDMAFFFNEELYKQIDGVAMDSPLGPTLANKKPFSGAKRATAKKSEVQIQVRKFLQYMNSQHKNIKFICELESNGKLPSLDASINRDNKSFSTATYRKPTYIGLTTKFDSFIPVKYKTNLINTLINRAYRISKSYLIFTKEIDYH